MQYYYPPGMPRTLDYVEATVPDLLISAAHRYGDRIAVVDGDETLSYRQLLVSAQSVASDLQAHGVGPGDVVGLHLPNNLHFFTAYYGALFTGAAITPVNPLQPPVALKRQLTETQAKAVISHAAHVEPLAEVVETVSLARIIVIQDNEDIKLESLFDAESAMVRLDELLAQPKTDFVPAEVSTHDVAHLAFTGGTTGDPKGVRVLHRNVIANVTQMCAWRFASFIVPDQQTVLALEPTPLRDINPIIPGEAATVQVPPLFHAQGLVNCASFMVAGITIVLQRRFNAETFFRDVQAWDVQYVSGNPPMYLALADYGKKTGAVLPSIRVAVSGAAPMTDAAAKKVATVLPNARIIEGYGLTEASCLATASPLTDDSITKLGSVGLPVADTFIEIRDTDGKTVLGDNEEGELWIRGPQVTDGYSNAPEQTAEQFVDGWLKTGDIGMRDSTGFIWIRDRAKDMLTYKGYNVYPKELEQVAAEHPGVAEVSVVGREVDDVGEVPVAFVVANEGYEDAAQDILRFVADRVLPYQKIRELHFVEKLPTSDAGKVLKREIRSLLEQQGETINS